MPQIADIFGVADSDVAMLRRAGVPEEDIDHCRRVESRRAQL